MCTEACKKEVKDMVANSKQNQINTYHHELEPVSSKKADCEMKCLAMKASHLRLSEKKSFCRKQCIYA